MGWIFRDPPTVDLSFIPISLKLSLKKHFYGFIIARVVFVPFTLENKTGSLENPGRLLAHYLSYENSAINFEGFSQQRFHCYMCVSKLEIG